MVKCIGILDLGLGIFGIGMWHVAWDTGEEAGTCTVCTGTTGSRKFPETETRNGHEGDGGDQDLLASCFAAELCAK